MKKMNKNVFVFHIYILYLDFSVKLDYLYN